MSIYQISEFDRIKPFVQGQVTIKANETYIPENAFNNLWDFILEKQSDGDSSDKAFSLYTSHGKRIIQAKNYVGVIETKSKDVIEILPKIYRVENNKKVKSIFLRMLRVLKDMNNISFNDADLLANEDFPILEIFINNYIVDVERLLLNDLKKGYKTIDSNQNFLKGKLLVKENLKYNFVDRSKFYVRFNHFDIDIPLNRVVKSTLLKLFKLTRLSRNRKTISRMLELLGTVPVSNNFSADLQMLNKSNRLLSNYSKVVEWSEVFLLGKGFTNFSGNNINQAMLFPMEKVFESFIAYQFKRYANKYPISTQHSELNLVENFNDKPKFRLKPDIFISNPKENKYIVIDAKWKIVNKNSIGKTIQQSDMYQLYAYGRKYLKGYGHTTLYLIYPANLNFTEALPPFYYEKNGDHWLKLYAIPFDLNGSYEEQIKEIIKSLDKEEPTN